MMGKFFIFGLGYVGGAFAKTLLGQGWSGVATARNSQTWEEVKAAGLQPVDPDDAQAVTWAVRDADAILITAPPGPGGCPGLAALAPAIGRAQAFPDWIGYLSTTGVYGDRRGGWV